MITVFDAAGGGSAKACWVLMRRASAHTPESDKFESASSPRKTSLLQAIMSCGPEKPDMYWSAPRAAERPVISVPEIGYVRRSELGFLDLHLAQADRFAARSLEMHRSVAQNLCDS